MKLCTIFLATTALLVAVAGNAAEVVLRDKAAPAGPIVRLSDLAVVTADTESATEVLAATPLMASPAPGTRQFLRVAQVRDRLVASGVNVREVRISGAESVVIEGPQSVARFVADESSAPGVGSAGEDYDTIAAEIARYLRFQSGHDMWDVKLVRDRDLRNLPTVGSGPITVTGGRAPWTGRQRFTISSRSKARGTTVTADINRVQMAAIAVRSIERGDLVRTTDVELRSYVGNLPLQAAASVEAVIGQEALQPIRAGAVVLSSQLRAPILVSRGERVAVRARADGISVRTYATAQQDGALGDLVMVQSLEGKDRYPARVTGSRELEIFAAGARASDVATHVR